LVLLCAALHKHDALILFMLLLSELLVRALVLSVPLLCGGRLLLSLTRPW
jgi:hypothetical protein